MSLSNTQLISSKNTFNSINYLDLLNKDVIDVFFVGDNNYIFSLNEDKTITLGMYVKDVEVYNGNDVVISTKIKFPSKENIFILKNYYNDIEYFFFYNVDNCIKFRTFNVEQGYFSEEKILTYEYTIKQKKQVYENNIFILEVNGTEEIFKLIGDLPNKELKIGFLFTSEIEKWNNYDETPILQILETPFNNISEISNTVENMVGSDKGFLYVEGDKTTEEYDEKSLNGNIIKNFDNIYVQMSGLENYTLTMRLLLSDINEEKVLLKTNNYELRYDGNKLYIYVDTSTDSELIATDASQPCVLQEVEVGNQLPLQVKEVEYSEDDYSLFFITNTLYNNENIITVYVGGKILEVKRDLTQTNQDYISDTYLKLSNIFKIDYLSQQNYALSLTQVNTLSNVFNEGANSQSLEFKKVFSYKQISDYIGLDNNEVVIDNIINDTISNVRIESTLDNDIKFKLNNDEYLLSNVDQINGSGKFSFIKDSSLPTKGKIEITYEVTTKTHQIQYTSNQKLNTTYQYKFGQYLPIRKDIDIELLRGAIVPYKIESKTGIPRVIFSDPEKEIRVGNSTSQVYDRVPFLIEDKYESGDYIIWVSLDNFNDNGIPVQYGLTNLDVMDTHTYSNYETLSTKTYSETDYYFSYHFNELINNNKILIKNLFIEDSGELFLVGNTYKNDYIREIKEIRFLDIPKKYRTSFFKVSIDTEDKNKTSFINNNTTIKTLTKDIIDEWKPSYTTLFGIEESNAVVMSNLLSDEYAQVLVGFTPNSNVNSYYVRSIESGELDIFTSSGRFDESIDWLAIGRMDSPYVKTGVTKVNSSSKQFKIFFESKMPTSEYRIMVFSPNNSKYYVPSKNEDGFIVESSHLVEDEVSWIAINSNQIMNGTLVWKEGIPEDQRRLSNLDRITEIGINSHKYTLNFTDLGFENFDSTDYSVILSCNSNINVWYDNKTLNSVDIRRGYTGSEIKIDYLIVKGDSRWFDGIVS